MTLVRNPLSAAIVVLLVGFALGSACGTGGGTGGGIGIGCGGGGVCAETNELCSAVICGETGQIDTSVGPLCCHGSCIVCARLGADINGICLDAPYCCPAGQFCLDDATCCSGSCGGLTPSEPTGSAGICL